MTCRQRVTIACGLAALAGFGLLPCAAWEFTAAVVDAEGAPVADAVVVLNAAAAVELPPVDGQAPAAVGQKNKAFVPRVMAVRTGTLVSFPNRDPIMHHVYSFSPTKSFELELYGGGEVPALLFDQAGIVALACNIHDSMRGHIYVTDSPWFAVSGDDGLVTIGNLPDVTFNVEVWHERELDGGSAPVSVAPGASAQRLVIAVRPAPVFEFSPHESGDY